MSIIEIDSNLKDKLSKFIEKNGFEGYQDAIDILLSNYLKKHKIIEAEENSIDLNFIKLDENGNGNIYNTLTITFQDLLNAKIGDKYSPLKSDSEYYSFENAIVVYKEKDFILLKITTTLKTLHSNEKTNQYVSFDLT